jgi:hypothetical protein
MKLRLFTLLIVCCALYGSASAQQTAKMTPGSNIGYLEYLPQDYKSNTNKYPLVISLHGIKEKGNTLSSLSLVDNVGLPRYVSYGQQYPFILISPQLKTSMGKWTGDYVMAVINHVKTYLRVDPSRIYLTGLSLGGGGVWSVVSAYPNVFAAIVPVCSGYNVKSGAPYIAGSDVPVWGFHGDADAIVSETVTISMISEVNKYKPSPTSKVTIFPKMGHNIWDKVYKETSALSWMLTFRNGAAAPDDSSQPVGNQAPLANAGADKTITLPTNSTSISGSATDSDGTIASYTWAKKSGGAATLSGTTSKILNVSGMVSGTYVFTLTVKDDKGATDTDDVNVIVKSATTNAAPIASAGANQTVILPATSTTIVGSAKDSDGTIASYSWTKVSGGSATLSGNTTATLKLSGLVSGKYIFRLTVKDNDGASHYDEMSIIVSDAPVVSAGSDRTVTLPLASLTLTATASDKNGIGSYMWYKASGPSVRLTNANTKTVTLSYLNEGVYTFRVTVKDTYGVITHDYVKVTVNDSVASIEKLDLNSAIETSLASL